MNRGLILPGNTAAPPDMDTRAPTAQQGARGGGNTESPGGSGEEIMFGRKSAEQNRTRTTTGHSPRSLMASVFLALALLVLALAANRRVQAAQGFPPQMGQTAAQQATQAEAASMPAAGFPFEIEADVIDYDPAAQVLTAQGAVTLVRGGVTLHADRVEVSLALNSLMATGRLALSWQGREVRGEELYLDMAAGKGRLRRASGTVSGVTFRGEEVSFDGDAITVEKGYLSTCDLDAPHYRLSGTRITIYPGSRAVVKGGWLRIGEVPVLPVLGTDIRLDGEGARLPVPRLYLNRETGFGAAVDVSYYLGGGSWADVTLGYASKKGFEGGLGVSAQLRGAAVSARADYTLDHEIKASLHVSKATGLGANVSATASYSTEAGTTLGIEASENVRLGEVLGLSDVLPGLTLAATADAALLVDVAPSEARLAAAPAGGPPVVGPSADTAMGATPGSERISGGKVQVGGELSTGRVAIGRSGHLQGTVSLSSAWYSAAGRPAQTRAVLAGSAEAGAKFTESLAGTLGYSVVKVTGATPFAYDYVEPSETLWGEVRLGLGDFSFAAKGTYDLLAQRYAGTTYAVAYRMHCLEASVTVDPIRGHLGFALKLAGF